MLFAQKNEKLGKRKESRSALPKAKENLINRIWYKAPPAAARSAHS